MGLRRVCAPEDDQVRTVLYLAEGRPRHPLLLDSDDGGAVADAGGGIDNPSHLLRKKDPQFGGLADRRAPAVEEGPLRLLQDLGGLVVRLLVGRLQQLSIHSDHGGRRPLVPQDLARAEPASPLHPDDLSLLHLDLDVVAEAAAEGAEDVLGDHLCPSVSRSAKSSRTPFTLRSVPVTSTSTPL